jgi:outer membrane protein TolC
MILKIFKTGLIVFCLATPMYAQQVLSLDDALQIGLQNNYSVQIARNDAAISSNNVTLGNAGFLPTVGMSGSLIQSINNSDQVYFSGDEVQKTGAKNTTASANAGLNWTLFDGLSMFITQDQLKTLEVNGYLQAKQQVENTMSLIMVAYYTILRDQYLLNALNEQLTISSFRKEITEVRFSVGSASKIEVLKATVDFNGDETSMLQQQAQLQKSKVQLNELLSRDVSSDFSVDTTIQQQSTLTYDKLREDLLMGNLDLKLSDQYVKLADLNVKQTNSLRYPSLTFSTGYDVLRSKSESGFLLSNNNSSFYYGLTAGFNIFDGFNISRQHQNDKISLTTTQLQKEQTMLSLQSQLKQMYLDYENNLKLLGLEEQNLKYAQENLNIASESYRIGQLSDLELREIQKNLIDAKFRLADALYTSKMQETDLMRITGNLVK